MKLSILVKGADVAFAGKKKAMRNIGTMVSAMNK
jgi:hypothetical protein